jgi:hypothetical protein
MTLPTPPTFLVAVHQVTRPLCTILVVATYCGLAAWGAVTPEAFKDVVLIVVGFWFGQRSTDRRATDAREARES